MRGYAKRKANETNPYIEKTAITCGCGLVIFVPPANASRWTRCADCAREKYNFEENERRKKLRKLLKTKLLNSKSNRRKK